MVSSCSHYRSFAPLTSYKMLRAQYLILIRPLTLNYAAHLVICSLASPHVWLMFSKRIALKTMHRQRYDKYSFKNIQKFQCHQTNPRVRMKIPSEQLIRLATESNILVRKIPGGVCACGVIRILK